MGRTIVIGDPHGCLDSLKELLDKLGPTSADAVCIAGDLTDRGPDPLGVVRLARRMGYVVCQSNHDEKYGRYHAWEKKVQSGEAKKNPMNIVGDRLDFYRLLDEDDLAWLAALPLVVPLFPGAVMVHGGMEARPVKSQGKQVIRTRWVDERTGRFAARGESVHARPEGAVPWTDKWCGPESVFYGHIVHSLEHPLVTENFPGVFTFGLDTGCCFGGRLTAAIVTDHDLRSVEFAQVQGRRAYAELSKNQRGIE